MSKVYIATQGVGSFLAGEVVTGLDESRVKELEESGALVVETAEQAKLRKATAAIDEADAADAEEEAAAKAAAAAKAEEEAAAAKAATTKK